MRQINPLTFSDQTTMIDNQKTQTIKTLSRKSSRGTENYGTVKIFAFHMTKSENSTFFDQDTCFPTIVSWTIFKVSGRNLFTKNWYFKSAFEQRQFILLQVDWNEGTIRTTKIFVELNFFAKKNFWNKTSEQFLNLKQKSLVTFPKNSFSSKPRYWLYKASSA